MDKPMTTEDLFNKIQDILKEKGKLPAILDYGLATRSPVPIKTYEFDLVNKLARGGNEGIYLDLWIEYYVNNKKEKKKLGTFKTLHEDNDTMHVMAGLLADFIIEGGGYINDHLDDFTGRVWMSMRLMKVGNATAGDLHAVIWRRHCTGRMNC